MKQSTLLHSKRTRLVPLWGQGVQAVWLRNFLQFRYTLWVTLCWIVLEPFLSLIAIGYGIGNYIAIIDGRTFIDFYFPGLITVTAFSVPFFEATYNFYSKITYQKTYQTILMTPISPSEILWAELLWAATKGLLSCFAISVVARMMGVYHSWLIIPAFVILFMTAFIGALCGVIFMTYARSYDFFNYAISGFLLPMTFFSDTYFPIQQLHWSLKGLIQAFPLIHGVRAVRFIMGSGMEEHFLIAIIALPLFGLLLLQWAYRRFRRKLIAG